jgi:DNA-binding MarR family transcriptional regulator
VEAPSPKPDDLAARGLESFAPYLMNRIMGRYNESLREEMAALGLTTPKMRALATLAVLDGLQISRLAVYCVTEPSTLSRALDQLESEGLVERRTDPGDARATRIHLTGAGRAAFDRLWPTMAAAQERLFAGIPAKERTAFTATLQRILRNIRQHDF